MCRLLGYLGPPLLLNRLLTDPEHSLIVQSYQPKELRTALLNADGFGVGWYRHDSFVPPFTYKHTLPIWNDVNLPQLGRYVESNCVVANVRSATPGLAVDLGNCQPFSSDQLLFVHNGYIDHFRHSLRRPICERLGQKAYQAIEGATDSEHLFALVLDCWYSDPQAGLIEALRRALSIVTDLAAMASVAILANAIVTDGQQLVACRYANESPAPSLYWIYDDPKWPGALAIASEPMFDGQWMPFEGMVLTAIANHAPQLYAL